MRRGRVIGAGVAMMRRATRRIAAALRTSPAGFTLVELLVSMVLLVVVGTVISTGLVATLHAESRSNSDDQVLAGVQRAGELLSRDLRDARSVPTAQAGKVSVWDDTNFDYVKQTGETVTWTMDSSSGTPLLCRSTDAGLKRCIPASSNITGLALTYSTLPSGAVGSIGVTLNYKSPSTSSIRSQQWSVTVRNAS